jgi:hypothetical protein
LDPSFPAFGPIVQQQPASTNIPLRPTQPNPGRNNTPASTIQVNTHLPSSERPSHRQQATSTHATSNKGIIDSHLVSSLDPNIASYTSSYVELRNTRVSSTSCDLNFGFTLLSFVRQRWHRAGSQALISLYTLCFQLQAPTFTHGALWKQ